MEKRLLLLLFALCSFLTPFLASSINLSMPTIGEEFHLDVITLGWVATGFILSSAIFLVPFGRLADIYGRSKIFIIGAILFTVSNFLCALATSGLFLILARIFQGISASMIFGTSMAMVTSIFPPEQRGKALGFNVAAVYFGSSLGPIIGGFLTHVSWRLIFISTGVLGIAVVVFSILLLKEEWAEAKGEKFDLLGSALYGVSVVAMLYGSTLLPQISGIVSIVAGLVLFIVFFIFEDRIKHPVFDVDLLLKNRLFAMSSLAALINYSATFAVSFLLSLYLQYALSMKPSDAGMILLAQPIMMALVSPLAGRLSDKTPVGLLASVGMGLTAIALFAFGWIDITSPVWLIVVLLALFGIGLGLFSSPNTNAAMGAVERRHLGVASSVISSMRMFGQMLSMGIVMFVFTMLIGKVKITPESVPQFLQSARILFFIFSGLSLIGVFASLSRNVKTEKAEI